MDRNKIRIPKDVYTDLEAVRKSGKINMLDVPMVIELAINMGHDATALWVRENIRAYVAGLFNGFEPIGGDQ